MCETCRETIFEEAQAKNHQVIIQKNITFRLGVCLKYSDYLFPGRGGFEFQVQALGDALV